MSRDNQDRTALLFKALLSIVAGGFAFLFTLHGVYHHVTNKLEESIHNDNNRIRLGEHIISGLHSIESDFYKTMTVFNRKGQELIFMRILATVEELDTIFSVVEEGGVYQHTIPLNIAEQKNVIQRIGYRPVHVDEYVVEILILRALLADIREQTQEKQELLDRRQATRAGQSLEKIKENADKFIFFFHNLQARFKRMEEHANRLYYDSKIHQENIRNQIEDQKNLYSFLATALSFLFVMIIFVLSHGITRRIRLHNWQLQEAHASLEQKVEERTAQLKQANQQLVQSEKLSAIGSLTASIAHEFNNPLCGVRNVMERMNRINNFNAADQELVTMALAECDRMKRLIQDLQSFNRPTNNIRTQINVHATMDSILFLIQKELKTKKVAVVKEYDAIIPRIYGVEDQLKQVFLNLLKNSGEALEEHGGIITISAGRQKESVFITIHDTGSGIKQEIIDHIFEPFFTTKSAVKGTGLGLSVSHGIIQSHGGDIRVASEPGRGTSFTVTLPIKSDTHPVKEEI